MSLHYTLPMSTNLNSLNQVIQHDVDVCLGRMLEAHAERNPDATAILAPDRAPLTYERLHNHVKDVTKKLNEMGLARHDRIAIVLPNGPEMATAFLAVATAATSAPLNPSYRREEFDFYLSDLDAKALIVPPGNDSPAIAVAKARGIAVIELVPTLEAEAGIFTLAGDKCSRPSNCGFAQTDDVALVLHTSGTTAKPKIVPLTHTNICTSALNVRAALELKAADRCLNMMPLFHIHGIVGAMLSSFMVGASVVCAPGFYAPRFFDWLEAFRPTWYTAVPTMHQAILQRAALNRDTIVRCPLRFIRSSSSSLPPSVMTELEDVFSAPVIEAYGMTEASHQMTSNPLPPRGRKCGSVGIAAGPEVAVMDEAGNLLAHDQVGEVVIRGANVMHGYEHNPAANQSAFSEGWFRTGDQGYLDVAGYLFLTGRLKEIINRGGEKISPREIDEVLMTHPAVMQAVTFAVPHARLGEDVAAVIVLHEQASVTGRELREYAAQQLADFKVPCRVLIVDEIPKGPTGKLQRIGLADKLNFVADEKTTELPKNYEAPRTPVEELLAKMWMEVLRVERVSIYDNFFHLGGDSVVATQLVARVQGALQVEMSMLSFFEAPTLVQMAATLEDLLLVESYEA